MRNILSDLIVD